MAKKVCQFATCLAAVLATSLLIIAQGAGALESRELRAGIPGHFPPQYIVESGAAPSGFAIDIFEAVADQGGFSVRYVMFATWPETLAALEAGQIDVIPNLGVTADRTRYARFSVPLETYPVSLFVRATERSINPDDLSGRVVGVVERNVGEQLMRARDGVTVMAHKSRADALFALLAGRVNAVVYPRDVMLELAREAGLEDRVQVVGAPLLEVRRAMAIRQDWPVVGARLSEVVERFVLTPEYRAIFSKWHAPPTPFWSSERIGAALVGILLLVVFGLLWWRQRSLARLRAAAEEERARAEEFQAIVDAAPDAIVLVDTSGMITLANAEAESLFGRPRETLVGSSVEELIPEAHRDAHIQHRANFVANPRPRAMGAGLELYGRKASGEPFPIDVNLSSVTVGGRTMVAAAVRDVTAHREIETALERAKDDAERSAATKARFLAAASHDLRQPLQALSMYLAVLGRSLEKAEGQEVAAKATQALNAMGGLLDALLDISKLDAGNVEPEISNVPVQALFDAVQASTAPLARDKGLVLEFDATPLAIRTDEALFLRILDNFVSNAVRYTEAGTVHVLCREEGGALRVEVADTGIGIPASALESIFDEYVQLNNPARDRRRGLGLGLSVVKRIADLLGHRVDVESTPGKGSVFSVVAPAGRVDLAPEPDAEVREPTNATGVIPVLYVEDDPAVLSATRLLLSTATRFVVSTATDINGAEKVVEQGAEPEVILSDFRLKRGETGIELVKRVRTAMERDIPAIIMTGDTSQQQIEATNLVHCQVVHKPVEADRLIELIEKAAASSRADATR